MENLIDAIIDVIEKKQRRDKVFEDCDGTWGHFGYDVEEQLSKAKRHFGELLKIIIVKNAPRGSPGPPYA